ncbi:DUF4349 domain-containing protein [Flavobacterium sp. ANB]|uniref:DUF4349 domain-containing protein n=1 Tax=unclassified Flavobacterium TaxID=196869 RepID=UPI0012B6B39E|nr:MULTISPECIES: DUF4349 domain-containing protein [unclassified Flavobacterium]MBF4517038.1 DUF4349 domain-containing protein [Flavobacterium sp. ANB]MTD71775.1 DUF4349 domain-containing protein [Flavobacterium sp. LC2016-13]
MRYISFLFLIVLGLTGCSKNEDEVYNNMAVSTVKVSPAYKSESLSDKDAEIPSPEIQQKIIKQASLRFETNDLESTFDQIETAIKANKGKVQNDSEGKDDGSVYRNITVRVPSQNFDAFISSVSKGVSYFERKDISSEDVTEEYIDLNSRLNTKRKLEARYIEILKKANKISEILEIEKQISAIREEIEAKEGRLKYLESRVSESTISIEFYKTIAQKEGVKISFGSKIWSAIKSGFFSLSEFLISVISVWPFILLFVILAYFIRKRFKRKKT